MIAVISLPLLVLFARRLGAQCFWPNGNTTHNPPDHATTTHQTGQCDGADWRIDGPAPDGASRSAVPESPRRRPPQTRRRKTRPSQTTAKEAESASAADEKAEAACVADKKVSAASVVDEEAEVVCVADEKVSAASAVDKEAEDVSAANEEAEVTCVHRGRTCGGRVCCRPTLDCACRRSYSHRQPDWARPGGQPTKAPIWMKPRPTKPPKEKQKAPRLGEKMKHLAPVFESQTNELQWTMYDNTKYMLDLCEKYTERPRASPVPTTSIITTKMISIRRESLNKNPLFILPAG